MPSSCEQCKAEVCYLSCPVGLAHGPSVNLWHWWGKSSPPSWRSRDPLPDGPIELGGGSKVKGNKKAQQKKPVVWGWYDG